MFETASGPTSTLARRGERSRSRLACFARTDGKRSDDRVFDGLVVACGPERLVLARYGGDLAALNDLRVELVVNVETGQNTELYANVLEVDDAAGTANLHVTFARAGASALLSAAASR